MLSFLFFTYFFSGIRPLMTHFGIIAVIGQLLFPYINAEVLIQNLIIIEF